jgi:hypothetical protein
VGFALLQLDVVFFGDFSVPLRLGIDERLEFLWFVATRSAQRIESISDLFRFERLDSHRSSSVRFGRGVNDTPIPWPIT